jgi:hypothetical protein
MTDETPSLQHFHGQTIISTPGTSIIIPGIWQLGEPHESESGLYTLPLLHTSQEDPVHVWALTKAELTDMDPERLVWQIPQGLRQKYVSDQGALEKALARLQAEIKKPWRKLVEEIRERREPGKRGAELATYIEELKTRILGAQVEPSPYATLEDLYEELVQYYKTTLSLDELTPYLFASYTLLTHQMPNLDFIFEIYVTGLKGSGKSTAGERLEKLCYQGFKTGCATFPFLVRANEVLNGMTQVLDEFDLIANDDYVTKYLRGSTDRNNPYGLVEPVTIGGQTHNMPAIKMSFGARILITSQQIRDEMVRDRALEVVMMQYAGFLTEPSAEATNTMKAYLAHYRQQVKLTVTLDDKRKWYEPKHTSGRLNEITTLLHLVTPEKYHGEVGAIIQREWEARTQLERESYAAKIVESLTAAVVAEDTVESSTAMIYIPVQQIKRHFDIHYSDPITGKGKASPRSIGRVMQNLGLRTDNIRVRDEDRRLRAWLLNKETLVRIRQSLYLDEAPDLGTSGTSGTLPGVCSASPPTSISMPNSALGDVPNVPNVPRPTTDDVGQPEQPIDGALGPSWAAQITSYAWQKDHPKGAPSPE